MDTPGSRGAMSMTIKAVVLACEYMRLGCINVLGVGYTREAARRRRVADAAKCSPRLGADMGQRKLQLPGDPRFSLRYHLHLARQRAPWLPDGRCEPDLATM